MLFLERTWASLELVEGPGFEDDDDNDDEGKRRSL